MTLITIVPTGTANLASVTSAFSRVGAETFAAKTTRDILGANALVLPGVGSFGASLERLRMNNWDGAIRQKIEAGVPVMAICLGMQILFESSEESPGVNGLGILQGHFERFPANIQTPHVGWNSIEPVGNTRILTAGDAYFTHSYRLHNLPSDISGAVTDYASPFISAIEIRNILACQFHPELSGKWGLDLLRRWLGKGASGC